MDLPVTHIFLHPGAGFMALAFLILLFRGKAWRWLLFIPPVMAMVITLKLEKGSYWMVPYLGQNLVLGRIDHLSLLFTSLFAIQSLICMIYAFHVREKAHHMASLFYVACSFGCILAKDYWSFFIFWELMTVSSTFLIWLNRTPRSTRAGFGYILFLTIGGIFLLAGILLRYRAMGTFAFDPVDATMVKHYDWLVLTGFCINAAVVPLHAWLTDAYPEATLPGAVFLSVFTTKTAVYALARCFPGLDVLVVLGVVMALYGALYAILASDIRRMLAYLMVSQIGYMVAGIGMGTAITVNGALTQAYAHTFYNSLLFMAAGCLIAASGKEDLRGTGGAGKALPFVMIGYMVGALSMSGLPLLNGFISTPMTVYGALEGGRPVISLILGITGTATFFAVGLRLPYVVFGSRPAGTGDLQPVPKNMYAAMGIASAMCFIQGIFPGLLYRLLPYPVDYLPYTRWKLLLVLALLGLTFLGFYVVRKSVRPQQGRTPDVDILYRKVARAVLDLICRPLAWVDGLWSAVYRVFGLRALLGAAAGAKWFDRRGVDTVVDGAAHKVRALGSISARMQSGRLQDQLAWMAVLALGLFALFWFWPWN